MNRYTCERCGDCGRGLTFIEIGFGRVNDPVCGRCLMKRQEWERQQEQQAKDINYGNLMGMMGEQDT